MSLVERYFSRHFYIIKVSLLERSILIREVHLLSIASIGREVSNGQGGIWGLCWQVVLAGKPEARNQACNHGNNVRDTRGCVLFSFVVE